MALIGENGAGKSTLMKILTGIYQKDDGAIEYFGENIEIHGPRDAQAKGISIVHQELNLMQDLTVAENIYIGREPSKGVFRQEVGYDHSFEFFERDAIPVERYREGHATRLYRSLCALKHRERALDAGERGGAMIEIENNAKDCMMTFVREVDGSRVVAIMNLSPYTIHADFNTGIYAGEYKNGITGERVILDEHVERDIEPWAYQILVKK